MLRWAVLLQIIIWSVPANADLPPSGVYRVEMAGTNDIAQVDLDISYPRLKVHLTTPGYLGRLWVGAGDKELKANISGSAITVFDAQSKPLFMVDATSEYGVYKGTFSSAPQGREVTLRYLGNRWHQEHLYQLCANTSDGPYQCKDVGTGERCGYPYVRGGKSTFLSKARCEDRARNNVMGNGRDDPDDELEKAGWTVSKDCREFLGNSGSNIKGKEKVSFRLENDTSRVYMLAAIGQNEDATPISQRAPGSYWQMGKWQKGYKLFVLDPERKRCVQLWKIPDGTKDGDTYRLSKIIAR